jgi:hypothetical protein
MFTIFWDMSGAILTISCRREPQQATKHSETFWRRVWSLDIWRKRRQFLFRNMTSVRVEPTCRLQPTGARTKELPFHTRPAHCAAAVSLDHERHWSPLSYWRRGVISGARPNETNFHGDIMAAGAGTAQWYRAGLWAGWSGVRVPVLSGNFSPHHLVQIGSGTHPASYPMGMRASFPGRKAAGE